MNDVFSIVEKKSGIRGFKDKRQSAEQFAREYFDDQEDVTLDQIYQVGKLPRSVKELEVETEYKVCHTNPEIKQLYDYCVSNSITVIFVSDMYLPVDVVETILKNNGYVDYDRLFLSSDEYKTKASGALFDLVKSTYPDKELLHIGDNKHSDIKMALDRNIRAIHYDFTGFDKDEISRGYIDYLSKSDQLSDSLLYSLIRDKIKEHNSPFYSIGYIYLGIILRGFIEWLNCQFKENNIDTIWFLSRDGHVVEQAYNLIYGDLSSHYVYASRRMLVSALLGSGQSVSDNDLKYYFSNKPFSEKMAHSMGVDVDSTASQVDIKNEILKIAKKEHDIVKDYYKTKIIDSKNIALVDIGWHGSSQSIIEKLFKKESIDFHGYLFGVYENKKSDYMEGYFCDTGFPIRLDRLAKEGCEVLEYLFTAPHPSVQTITEEFQPVYSEKDRYEGFENVHELQRGALDYLKDLEVAVDRSAIDVDYMYCGIKAAELLISRPGKIDALKLGDIEHVVFSGESEKSPIIYNIDRYNKGRLNRFIFYLTSHKSMWRQGALALQPRFFAVPFNTAYFSSEKIRYIFSYIRRKGLLHFFKRAFFHFYSYILKRMPLLNRDI